MEAECTDRLRAAAVTHPTHARGRHSAVLFSLLVCAASISGIEIGIGRQAIERAIELGRRGGDQLQSFHRRYTIQVGNPTVQSIEVVTEFRRVVLAKEEALRAGDHLFSLNDAENVLRSSRGRLSIVAHLKFNPQNTFVGLPPYEIRLAGNRGSSDTVPLDTRRNPIYSGPTLVGADIEVIFDAAMLARTTRTVVVQLPPNQVIAAAVNFASLE